MQRQAIVAGQFYPDRPQDLRRQLESFMPPDVVAKRVRGLMAPHAGYVYSGAIAGEGFSRVLVPETVILIGPNHHGIGAAAALYNRGSWLTPLGEVAIDEQLARALLSGVPGLAADPAAHRYEHSLEVMLPFLQLRRPDVRIVPLMLQSHSFSDLAGMGEALAAMIRDHEETQGTRVLLLASSDMSHYEPAEVARAHDLPVLERLITLDAAGLYQRVLQQRVSMCGIFAATLLLTTLTALGCKRGELVRYGNSGEVSGDMSSVVGYASALFS
ncbi:MAG: AmmeMemoRadiSam system protein B [Desulfuromonadaceae bacterium]|nr:AmmeMemoRadiSam system protein B [Desulfuromonadaceae bacterium]